MGRRRFFISPDLIHGDIAVLDHDQAHHLRHVLRLGPGDEVELFDGRGCGYKCRIEACSPEVQVRLIEKIAAGSDLRPQLVLAAALIKQDRFEWMLQKSAELGVDRIIPLQTHFSNFRLADAGSRRERWCRIVQEAAKQCRRLTVPEISVPVPLPALLGSPEFSGHSRLMLHEPAGERLHFAPESGHPVLLCVGPEGGWDAEEARAAQQAGFRLIRLGPRILRAETAALAGLAILQFLLDE